jgi:prepilin-type N-terminal cleavage/methylation domain-containing protein
MFFKKDKGIQKTSAGFTLVELLVSLFIFSVVMTVSMGALLVLIDANEKGQGVQTVMSNLSFAIDSMTRDMRTGYGYYCNNSGSGFNNHWADTEEINGIDEYEPADCDNGSGIAFVDSRTGKRTAYRLNTTDDTDGFIERCFDEDSSDSAEECEDGWLRLTSAEIDIDQFLVSVEGSEQGVFGVGLSASTEWVQPTAIFLYEGTIKSDEDPDSDFYLQTTVTQRILDL